MLRAAGLTQGDSEGDPTRALSSLPQAPLGLPSCAPVELGRLGGSKGASTAQGTLRGGMRWPPKRHQL